MVGEESTQEPDEPVGRGVLRDVVMSSPLQPATSVSDFVSP